MTNAFQNSGCPVRAVPQIDFTSLILSCEVAAPPPPILDCEDPDMAMSGVDGASIVGPAGPCPTLQITANSEIQMIDQQSPPSVQVQIQTLPSCRYLWTFLFAIPKYCTAITANASSTVASPGSPPTVDLTVSMSEESCEATFDFTFTLSPQGAQGARGQMGNQGPGGGPPGQMGPPGGLGPQGFQGGRGQRGEKGQTGDMGNQGGRGYQGQRGQRGQRGPDGGPGGPGSPGGPGPTGQGFNWMGPWSPIGYGTYDVVFFEGSAFVGYPGTPTGDPSSGTNWSMMAQRGALGFQGPTGSPGGVGGPGAQGGRGYQGQRGPLGFQGPGGGPQGGRGYQGFRGYQGYQGRGYQGYQGYQGHRGYQGYRGYQGFRGYQGYRGYQGFRGLEGPENVLAYILLGL